ncbi:MAG: hypothetical protein MHM6MM_005044 [Cercozoa sp. M6MM]
MTDTVLGKRSRNETADTAAEILKQIEFYLGDSNLPTDRHLQELLKESEEGWLDIAHFLRFNKVKALSEDAEEVANALRQSAKLLEVSEDGTKVRRKQAIANMAEARKALFARMLFAKPVPLTSTMEEIKAFFEDKCGKSVLSVRTRTFVDKSGARKRKPSVFVEFESPEVVEEVKKMQLVWEDEETKAFLTEEGFMHLMSRPEHAAQEKEAHGKKDGKKNARDALVRDRLLTLEGLAAGTTFRQVRDALGEHADVVFASVEEKDGKVSSLVRLLQGTQKKTASALAELINANDDFKINETHPTAKALAGDEEEQVWQQQMSILKQAGGHKKRRGHRK